MTYFGTKVRSCPIDDKDTEMLLLKLLLREALSSGLAVGYNTRLFAIPTEDKIIIVRASEPDRAIEISRKRLADAVDRFVDAFVYESDAVLDKVLFYHSADTTDAANTWEWLKQSQMISTIISHKPALSKLLEDRSSAQA